MQGFTAQVKNERAFVFESAGSVETGSSDSGIDKNLRKHGARNHGFYMLKKRPADAAVPGVGCDIQQPDLIHIQSGEAQEPVFFFVNSDIKERGALPHALSRFTGADFGEQRRRIGSIGIKAGVDNPATGKSIFGLKWSNHFASLPQSHQFLELWEHFGWYILQLET